eukprot:TRINITY_DN2807_c0_g1_i1.p1 TRINITY_DN2807_c0_g1~~TRINITY_DN2807_c0_g1_i1.p1  ORF type:complete len:1659 (-),score=312.51 TRINITY_DN2807_c0_g1_i1:74-4744(-)
MVLNFIQKPLFASPRPLGSCDTSCGMPSGEAFWSSGLFTIYLIDLLFSWALPHLTTSDADTLRDVERGGGTPSGVAAQAHQTEPSASSGAVDSAYTLEQAEHLGYYTISTRAFLFRFILLMLLLGPVPVSRMLLWDSTYGQMMVGIVEGALLAIVFHVLFVKLFKSTALTDSSEPYAFATKVWVLLSRVAPLGDAEQSLLPSGAATAEDSDHPAALGCRHAQTITGLEFLSIRTDTLLNSLNEKRELGNAKIRELEQDLANRKAAIEKKFKEEVSIRQDSVKLLIETSENMQALVAFIEEGNWLQLTVKHSELEELIAKHRSDDSSPEFKQIATTLLPVFESRLREAASFLDNWPELVLAVSGALKRAETMTLETDTAELKAKAKDLFDAVTVLIKNKLTIHKAEAAIKEGLVPGLTSEGAGLGQQIETWLCDRWQMSVAKNLKHEEHGNTIKKLQQKIIHDALFATEIADFDFTDLETCCEAVDVLQATFLSKAWTLLNKRTVCEYKGILTQLGTMLYFLDHLEKEDLETTSQLFAQEVKSNANKCVSQWVQEVAKEYTEHNALLQPEDLKDIANKDVEKVIRDMKQEKRAEQCKCFGNFYSIFIALAEAWQEEFGVLAVPHHTQVFALLVFKKLFEQRLEAGATAAAVKTLVAQVSTGEGKSMLLAELATFLAMLGKKVHVMSNDPKLVKRDFEAFQGLFRKCGFDSRQAVVCIGEDKIPDDAVIVYCEARQVMSFYTQKARCGQLGPKVYENRILVIDEVDALVVDESPSQEIVYDVGWRKMEGTETTITEYVTGLLRHLMTRPGLRWSEEELPREYRPPESGEKRQIYDEAVRQLKKVKEWKKRKQEDRDEDFRIYEGSANPENSDVVGKYVHVIKGKPSLNTMTNMLETLRLHEQRDYRMRWFQRLFVVSKPRVFRQYEHILGLSGTIGNNQEQQYFKDSFGANFFIVPPFLKTCIDKRDRDKNFYHTADWAWEEREVLPGGESRSVKMFKGITDDETEGGPCVIVANGDEQIDRVRRLAFQAHKHVPVLIIAKDSIQCNEVVRKLRAKAEGEGLTTRDIGSLSNDDYAIDQHSYKATLKNATQAVMSDGNKQFRITVTDPTGARGTDYKMSDEDPDRMGGLMLIILEIPLSEREWVQYKGRTARQKWRGQYCAVLNANSYKTLEEKMVQAHPDVYKKDKVDLHILRPEIYKQVLETGEPFVSKTKQDAFDIVHGIHAFGEAGSLASLSQTKAVYNAGFIVNEVCEKVWLKWSELSRTHEGRKVKVDVKLNGQARDNFLTLCRDYRYRCAAGPDGLEGLINGIASLEGEKLAFTLGDSEAPDKKYIPEERPKANARNRKAVLFMMDCSRSMSTKIPAGCSRLEACEKQMHDLLTDDGFVGEEDCVGVIAFGKGHEMLLELGQGNQGRVGELIRNHQFEEVMGRRGLGTDMWSTLATYIKHLREENSWIPEEAKGSQLDRIIILLCDGADSRGGSCMKEVEKLLHESITIIIIAVGGDDALKRQFDDIQKLLRDGSDRSSLFSADDDPTKITEAFRLVQNALNFAEGMGITE